jgi:hypothetical protein
MPARRLLLASRALPAAALLAFAGGCASPGVEAQWSDPQSAGTSLRGARVLIACDASEDVVKRLCQERLAEEVTARGATAVAAPDVVNPVPGRPMGLEQYAGAARAAGVSMVLATTVSLSASDVTPGFSIGIGGFSGGHHGGGGVGISMPVGGGQVVSGYTANSRLANVSDSRVLWTARASTPPSGDVNAQIAQLARTMAEAAEKAGMF